MAYIGRDVDKISNVEVLDNITFDGSSSYTLQKGGSNFTPSSANTLLVSIDGVVQAGNFTVSGSTIDFGTAVAGTSTCDFILHYGIGLITTPADNTVSLAKLTATGTKDATTFLRGDNTFATAGLNGWSEDGANNNLLPASASAGIYLGVSSATAANLLDDYEEGTFTPTFTSTSASFSYSQQHGFYTKIGRSVTCHIFIRGQSSGTTSNALKITNLPFTSINAGLFFASPTFGQIESIDYPTGALEITGNVPGNATQIDLQYSRDNAGSLSLLASAIDGATSNGFMVSINYFTD
jgi:hypothetical protein